jgi:DNA-binding CsgD family transcriptional regulator
LGNFDDPQPGLTKALLGRSRDLTLMGAFLDRAGTDGEALLLSGEPGVGKTALLDAAADVASEAGTWVLRAAGVEFEADMPYSGLHQALLPVCEEFPQLSATHRDALNVALGFGEGPAPDRLLVSNAALTVLRQVAAARPVVVIVDDLPWLDRASAVVLGFVARRLAGSRVGFLAASRSEQASFFERAGLPQHELAPLDQEAANGLVSARFPKLARRVRQRVLAEAGGNPLALLELSAVSSGSQPGPLAGLPAVLPLSRRLQAMFASRVTELPASTRWLLLLMALDGTGDLRVLEASGARREGLDDFAAAEQARLAYVDQRSHRLSFRHPLIRSAVVELSTDDERRRAHAELAGLQADQPNRQAWHLAEAAVGSDEHVAVLLEQAAHRILRRGDAVGAVAALTRAAELSPPGADRSRRLAEAALMGADVTGELHTASQLVADARMADPDPRGSLEAAVAAAYVLINGEGDFDTAHRLLAGTIGSAAGLAEVSDDALGEALYTLMSLCIFGGRAELWAPFHDALARLTPDVHPILYLIYRIVADPVRTAAPALGQLDAAVEGLTGEVDPARIVRIAGAAGFVDRLTGGGQQALWRVVRDGREGGAVASGIHALMMLARVGFRTGHWDEAQQLVGEGVELSETHGYSILTCVGRHVQALLAAGRGDNDTTRALADEMIQWAAPRRARTIQAYAWEARGLVALGRGDFEEAYQQAAAISPAGVFASHVLNALHVPMDLVEAVVRPGHHAEAAAHVAAMRDADIAALSPRLALLAGGSAAIAAPDDSAPGLFEEALAIPGAGRWPFDLARVQLAYGERLRRAQGTTGSRLHLTAALETFERLGARPWADRAASELWATGLAKPRAPGRDCVSLTPQERQIALLAAAGLSNKQIGQRLFLSPRTVGGHLHRIFPKLGITSRAALHAALAPLPSAQEPERDS